MRKSHQMASALADEACRVQCDVCVSLVKHCCHPSQHTVQNSQKAELWNNSEHVAFKLPA